jgi:hypothetical protein
MMMMMMMMMMIVKDVQVLAEPMKTLKTCGIWCIQIGV